MSRKLRVGYVREHFSSPFLKLASKDSTSFELIECGGGTGQMISGLREGRLDLVIALTEALITGIAKKLDTEDEEGDYKLIGTYVTSPMTWAVIAGKNTKYNSIGDLRGSKIGISRHGSGSEIMSYYMVHLYGEGAYHSNGTEKDSIEPFGPVEFVVNNDFVTLRQSVNDGSTSVFLWEFFTTKPFTSAGTDEVRFIETVPTPWPSWSIAANPSSASVKAQITTFLTSLETEVHAFNLPETQLADVEFIHETYGLKKEDASSWLNSVKYPKGKLMDIKKETVLKTLDILVTAGTLKSPEKGWDPNRFIDRSLVQELSEGTYGKEEGW